MMKQALSAIVCLMAYSSLWAFPSQPEIKKAKPIVGALIANDIQAANAGKANRSDVAGKIHGFVNDAETDAAKWLLLKHAFIQYAKDGNYDKATDVMSEILGLFPDVPPATVLDLIAKNAGGANADNAAALMEYRDLFAMRQKCNAVLANPKSSKLKKAEAQCLLGNWKVGLVALSKLNGDVGSIAAVELESDKPSVEVADFWWGYKSTLDSCAVFRSHAAEIYEKCLRENSLTGLYRKVAEQRIAEFKSGGISLSAGSSQSGNKQGSASSRAGSAETDCSGAGKKSATTSLAKSSNLNSRPKRPNGLKDIDRKNLPKLWSAPGVKEHVLKQGNGADDLIFVECPPGDFVMGFREDKGDAFYRHRVTLTYPFWILKTQLTNGQSYCPGICDSGKGGRHGRNGWACTGISAYLAFLNQKFSSQIPKGYVIRFPTFAEYQYAYRANATDPADPYAHDHFSGDDSMRVCHNSEARKGWNGNRRTWTRVWPAEVGLLEPNDWGIYDMAGNGYTYLCDRINPDVSAASHYRFSEHETDPIIYEENAGCLLMRGGDSPDWIFAHFISTWRWAFSYRLVVGPDLEKEGRKRAEQENLKRHDSLYQDMLGQLSDRKTGPSRPGSIKVIQFFPGQSMQFVTCPAGTFTMGHEFFKGPFYKHEVTISRPFMMATERLTMGLWFAYLEANGKPVPEEKRLYAKKRGGDRSALCGISSDEWKDFIDWLNGKFARAIPKGYVFRLPTEAEWEYAYRAGSNRADDPFAWSVPFVGNQAAAAQSYSYTEDERRADFLRYGNGRVTDTVWSAYTTDWHRMTLVDPGIVGKKKPNAWGLKDMIGNGCEFVLDRFDFDVGKFPVDEYCKETSATDPVFGFQLDKWGCQMARGGDDGYAGRKCWHMYQCDQCDYWYPTSLFCYRLVIGPDLIAEKRAGKTAETQQN